MYIKLSILLSAAVLAATVVIAQAPSAAPAKGEAVKAKGKRDPFQSPASSVRPKAVQKQEYPAALVAAGESKFVAECGFCHGRDATGGEGGPDLTRSDLVATDLNGEGISELVREGVPDEGMPSFRFTDDEMKELVAFIHTQHVKFKSLAGNRRQVDPEDLLTGNATTGRAYFNSNCARCHSATGDLKDIASRFQGLQLMQRMLYPTTGRPAPARPKATVTLASGQTVAGPLMAEDEFSLVIQSGDERRSFEKRTVKYTVDDPLQAHFEQLGKYTDADMHNVYAYLVTLK